MRWSPRLAASCALLGGLSLSGAAERFVLGTGSGEVGTGLLSDAVRAGRSVYLCTRGRLGSPSAGGLCPSCAETVTGTRAELSQSLGQPLRRDGSYACRDYSEPARLLCMDDITGQRSALIELHVRHWQANRSLFDNQTDLCIVRPQMEPVAICLAGRRRRAGYTGRRIRPRAPLAKRITGPVKTPPLNYLRAPATQWRHCGRL